MEKEFSLQEAKERREELVRTLDELNSWFAERRNTYKELQRFIQFGLQTGRITECRKEGLGKRYLSRRMIATIEVDGNLLFRSMLMMNSRAVALKQELAELDERIKESA